METKPVWIDIHTACEIGNFNTNAGLQSFIRRFNERHPEALIMKRWGRVERSSFEKALMLDATDRTPGARVVAGMGAHC